MKVKLIGKEESYETEGRDPDGLIPEGAKMALVKYAEDGTVKGIFYSKRGPKFSEKSFEEDHKRYGKELEQMNSRIQTPEEMRQVRDKLVELAQQGATD